MSRKRRIRFENLKHAAKVEKENSCSLWTTNLFFYAFIQAWNMQVCLDKLLCYRLICILHKNLFSDVCEAFSLFQIIFIKVSFAFLLLDKRDFPCLCPTLVWEWRSVTVCLWVKRRNGLSRQSRIFYAWK